MVLLFDDGGDDFRFVTVQGLAQQEPTVGLNQSLND